MLILKEDKVFCFDTVLQVLILKKLYLNSLVHSVLDFCPTFLVRDLLARPDILVVQSGPVRLASSGGQLPM